MAKESQTTEVPWWEMPALPHRPQYLQVRLTLLERQPAGAERLAALALLRW